MIRAIRGNQWGATERRTEQTDDMYAAASAAFPESEGSG
jgi:hypothetical protein